MLSHVPPEGNWEPDLDPEPFESALRLQIFGALPSVGEKRSMQLKERPAQQPESMLPFQGNQWYDELPLPDLNLRMRRQDLRLLSSEPTPVIPARHKQ